MKTFSGKQFSDALKYAFQACPADGELSHVVFVGTRVIAADGTWWAVGYLPEEAAFDEPLVVTCQTVDDLLLALKYAGTMAKRHDADFVVKVDGSTVTLHYGNKKKDVIHHELERAKVGFVPDAFIEPVADGAPPRDDVPVSALAGAHLALVPKWKGDVTITWRGEGGREPVRYDLNTNDGRVASAFILPSGRAPAQLPPDEPLLARQDDKPSGRSILDLRLDLDTKQAKTFQIGDVEIDVTGIADPDRLVVIGCEHREGAEPCHICTQQAVAGERAKMAAAAKETEAKAGKRRGRRKADTDDGDGAEAETIQ